LTKEKGKPMEHCWAKHIVATIHPSTILRIPEAEGRHKEYARLVGDFKKVRNLLKK